VPSMADEQGILTAVIKQHLADKSAEKRKQAASDIEQRVRDALRSPSSWAVAAAGAGAGAVGAVPVAVGGSLASSATTVSDQGVHDHIRRAIRCLTEDFCTQANPFRRKGGLLGLSSLAIALEHKPVQIHVSLLVPPVLTCFSDEDPTVRYSACEAFYNIAKVARHGILDKHLGAVFDGLCRLYADVEPSVKDGAQFLDRLVRDIATETKDFKFSDFIPMLTTRIRVLNPSVLQLVLGWISLLDSVPQVDMIVYLPQYLEGLFNIVRNDNRDIRRNAELLLDELLKEITSAANERPPDRAQRAIADAAEMVARCCRAGEWRSEDEIVRLQALHWLLEFVKLQVQLDGIAGPDDLDPAPSPLPLRLGHGRAASYDAAMPGAGGTDTGGGSGESSAGGRLAAEGTRTGLQQLLPILLSGALHCMDDGSLYDDEGEFRKKAEEADLRLQRAALTLGSQLPVEAVVDTLLGVMQEGPCKERSKAVLLKCFEWAQILFSQRPEEVLRPAVRNRLMEAALAALDRPEDEVAIAALKLISHLVTPGQDHASASADCQSPGSAFSGISGSPPRRTLPCEDLFSITCHEIYRIVGREARPECKKGHTLIGFARYSEKHGVCEGCGRDGVVPPEQLFRCEACDYDLCIQCRNTEVATLTGRCELIVRKVCEGVQPACGKTPYTEDVADRFFTTAARAVALEEDLAFAQRLVRVLNRVLLTSRETQALRRRLREEALAAPRPGGCQVGEVPAHLQELLSSWFHCPVSTLALCLWLHWFEMADEVTARLACMEQTPTMQQQLRDLAELLESPIFMRVRLQLLETRRRPALLRAVLGLSALLPQETALRARLEFVQTALMLDRAGKASLDVVGASGGRVIAAGGATAWALARFDKVTALHKAWRPMEAT